MKRDYNTTPILMPFPNLLFPQFHNGTLHDLNLCVCVSVCLTNQRGGSKLADIIAIAFIRHTAIGWILAILHSMMHKK